MNRIFVSRLIPDQGLNLLKKQKGVVVDIYEKDQIIPRKELLKRARGAVAILSILTDKIDAEVMNAAGPSLKVIANFAVGFDNIDLVEAKKRGIAVSNAPALEVAETVAEHTVALFLALAHRVVETDKFARAGKYHGWGPLMFLGTDLFGKTIGIVGAGRIGSNVARRLQGFGVKILYSDIKRNAEFEKATSAKYATLPALLKKSDFITIHVPLLPSTRYLISTPELKLMKPTSFIVNTSRGPIVDEKALLKALTKKQIAGAGLDVYECEPAIDCDLTDTHELRKLDNVVMTPHTASATWEARQAMSLAAARNIIAVLTGKRAPNAIK